MGEEWRQKTYYDKRVLIETDRVLNPQGVDSLLCITAAQAEMMRNLCQYLRRRSTFVSQYDEGYYLAPTEAEWDDILEIVAELEETLMGCEDIITALEGIQAAVACLCNKASRRPDYTPVTDDIIDWYVDDGVVRYDNPYPAETVVDANRCAIAQLTYQAAYETLTEWVQPAQDFASDVIVGAVLAAIAAATAPATFLTPASGLLAIIWLLVDVWERGEQQNVANTLVSNKEEIICALYDGLLTSAKTRLMPPQ